MVFVSTSTHGMRVLIPAQPQMEAGIRPYNKIIPKNTIWCPPSPAGPAKYVHEMKLGWAARWAHRLQVPLQSGDYILCVSSWTAQQQRRLARLNVLYKQGTCRSEVYVPGCPRSLYLAHCAGQARHGSSANTRKCSCRVGGLK